MNETADSYLARRNPVVKLGVLLLLSLMLTVIFDPVTPSVFALMGVLAAWRLGGVGLARLLKTMAPMLAAAVGIMVANLLFGREVAGDAVLGSWGPFTVTQSRLMMGGSIALRVLAFSALSLSFVFTTEPGAFVLSLVQQLRLNYRVAFGVLVGYRMMPLLQSEYQNIRAAQRARGMAEGRGPVAWLQRTRRYAIPCWPVLCGGRAEWRWPWTRGDSGPLRNAPTFAVCAWKRPIGCSRRGPWLWESARW